MVYTSRAWEHRQCQATRRDGVRCRAWACWGDPQQHCRTHGGRSLLEEVRNAVFALRIPLNEFIVEAFAEKLERMKQEHNGGKPFPQRLPGRRVS